MRKRIILSVIVGVLSIVFLVIIIVSSVQASKLRKRTWYIENINPGIRIEVVNATGVNGLAAKVTYLLRQDGFDVVYYTSVKDTINKTVIVERSDSSLSHAIYVGEWLGCDETTLEWDYDKISDCTIVLGMDFLKYFPGIDTATIIY
ncbi:MAG TPA: LytR C-terminal domain-containing protein [Candidatus Hydrothermia bacterium]|nr:LytR C-terminal domain-containing protein [Candidatus Hydrothermae bacterium]MDD3648977.1 LytR C-terminal domain-containing protein [Candidatus Hydrothermia bacterium]MDD5573108.1 LytR C-terminal domain-containing protein [Candidatus Hydrothermia bacterium]HOP31821.1 LytR C-terminal domain-containing protein [Candidatus Hydrothermia bacterium]